MTRVVAGTNVYISALLFGGLPGTSLDLVLFSSGDRHPRKLGAYAGGPIITVRLFLEASEVPR